MQTYVQKVRALSKVIQKTGLGEHLCDAIAVTVYDAGYRKIPEGAIILTKEERAALNEYQKKLDAGGDPFEKEQKE